MQKKVLWIWLGVLALALTLSLSGCSDPSAAQRGPTTESPGAASSKQVVVTPTARFTAAPSDRREALAEAIDLATVAEIERREIEASRDAETVASAQRGPSLSGPNGIATRARTDLVQTDRFRALPIDQTPPIDATPPVDTSPRVSFRELEVVVPAGSILEVELVDSLSSQASQPGDRFLARVVSTLTVDGYVAVPSGSDVTGFVSHVRRLKKIGGRAELELEFDRLLLPDQELAVRAFLYDEGKGETKRDAATIGGAAAAGALIGRGLGDKNRTRGGAIGALIGAAIGTGVAVATDGETVELPAGTTLSLTLQDDLVVIVRIRVIES